MSVILGIDIGGSTTKIVGLREDRSVIAMHRVQAQDPITSLYGALGNFLFSNGLELSNVSKVVLTGVGSSFVDGNIYGIPTEKVEEFTAVGTGGLFGDPDADLPLQRPGPGCCQSLHVVAHSLASLFLDRESTLQASSVFSLVMTRLDAWMGRSVAVPSAWLIVIPSMETRPVLV